ncbi:MAG: hypothetical protein AABY22_19645 [Nanoarchaeota archaeon]
MNIETDLIGRECDCLVNTTWFRGTIRGVFSENSDVYFLVEYRRLDTAFIDKFKIKSVVFNKNNDSRIFP